MRMENDGEGQGITLQPVTQATIPTPDMAARECEVGVRTWPPKTFRGSWSRVASPPQTRATELQDYPEQRRVIANPERGRFVKPVADIAED